MLLKIVLGSPRSKITFLEEDDSGLAPADILLHVLDAKADDVQIHLGLVLLRD
jgi:hypothetical protein